MKKTKLIAGVLIAVMAMSMAACKETKRRIRTNNNNSSSEKLESIELIGDPVTEDDNDFFTHSKGEGEHILSKCFITDTLPAIADLPLVSGLKNTIYCTTVGNKTVNEELTAYIFDYTEKYKWNTEDAYAAFSGKLTDDFVYQPGGDIMVEAEKQKAFVFNGELPKGMDPGVYTIVFVDGDNNIRGIKDCDLVATVEVRDDYKSNHYVDKPVIYLYPEEETEVNVTLDLDFDLATTYPQYNSGWNVTAFPDGRLINAADGRSYDYLFWEGKTQMVFGNFDKAICVKGEDTVEFLEAYLTAAGLNDSEIDDFISFWLPKMECNEYNLISFPTEEYAESARLNVSPAPDTEIRVFMVFKALDEEIAIPEGHELTMPETQAREGFTVVEWGGSEIK